MREALRGYAPPPHRCELIRTLDGVEYLNDSKATNLHALESALRSQTRPVVLIAGGKDKGLDYSPVLPCCARRHSPRSPSARSPGRSPICLPAVPTRRSPPLTDAVSVARSLAPRGSTVLLSPGTSSFDQFSGYEQRGNAFRDLVHQLR
jgi:UDP-N-acetylmuramoylalanine--D-glutamate ligase